MSDVNGVKTFVSIETAQKKIEDTITYNKVYIMSGNII